MGRLCGGAHEISGIKAPLFLHGGWLEGSWGGVVGGCMVVVVWGWVCGWILVGWMVRVGHGGVVGSGWVGDVMGSGWGDGVHLIGKIIFSLGK